MSNCNQNSKFCTHSDHQIWNALNPITEFWDYDIALEQLVKAKYYDAENLDDYSNYPKVLVDFKENHQVAFNAFGGLLYYLKMLKLDTSIMSLGNIHEYHISRNSAFTYDFRWYYIEQFGNSQQHKRWYY